jgi:Na+/H+ antiporter NhaD/arsenite permease-like protein
MVFCPADFVVRRETHPVKTVLAFLKQDLVLSISALCAIVTMFFVPPDGGYVAYMDLRVLCLLLCLMAVVAGFGSCGAFSALAYALLRRCRRGQVLGVVLVMLPFFTSMLVTNDVALLTFVPSGISTS